MTDLRVTDEVLADAERLLGRLHSEFGGISEHRDDLRHIWGASPMAHAMDAFADTDPVPGDPDAILDEVAHLKVVAAMLRREAGDLRVIAQGDGLEGRYA